MLYNKTYIFKQLDHKTRSQLNWKQNTCNIMKTIIKSYFLVERIWSRNWKVASPLHLFRHVSTVSNKTKGLLLREAVVTSASQTLKKPFVRRTWEHQGRSAGILSIQSNKWETNTGQKRDLGWTLSSEAHTFRTYKTKQASRRVSSSTFRPDVREASGNTSWWSRWRKQTLTSILKYPRST